MLGALLGSALQRGLSSRSRPQSHWERALPLFLPACQCVEQSWLCERHGNCSWVDVHALANLNHLKAHSGESVTLRPLGRVYRLTDKVCSHQSPEISRETLTH